MKEFETVTNAATAPAATPSSHSATLRDIRIDVYKYRWLFIGISLLFLIPGVFFIISNMLNPAIQAPLRLGIDFKGGSFLEYRFPGHLQQDDVNIIRTTMDHYGYTGSVIQIQQDTPSKAVPPAPPDVSPRASRQGVADHGGQATINHRGQAMVDHGGQTTVVSIRSKAIQQADQEKILADLDRHFGRLTLLQQNTIGPSLANELLTQGAMALMMAYLLIVGYLTWRFQFDFAICAMVALVHDTLFLFGMFAMFGALFHTEIDALFITALLTVVGFSVHDTIVVFDRIRENNRLLFTKKTPFTTIVNLSVNQTLARSINTSLTVLLTMLAMYFFGGETTHDFVLAIILGLVTGTYSSIFNASVLLAMWRNRNPKAA